MKDLNTEMEVMLDNLLDNMGPYHHPGKMIDITGSAEDDVEGIENEEMPENGPSEEDNPNKETNSLNNVPNQDAVTLLTALKKDIGESFFKYLIGKSAILVRENDAYKNHFKSMLAKWGAKTPADIPADKKKEFFNAVDKSWKAKNE